MLVGELLKGSRLEDQINLEMEAISQGVARYRKLARETMERGEGASLKPGERLIVFWFPAMTMAIEEEKRLIATGVPGKGRGIYGPLLEILDSERLAVIAMHTMLSETMRDPNGITVVKLAYSIGNAVVAEAHLDALKENHQATLKAVDQKCKARKPKIINFWAKKTLEEPYWSRRVCTHLGSILVNLALKVASMEYEEDKWVPAFRHEFQWRGRQRAGVIRLTDIALKSIEDGHLFRQHLRPRFMPMVTAPCLWNEEAEGGFIRVKAPFICRATPEHREALKGASLGTVYEAMNALNAPAWTINKPMLRLLEKLWESGGGVSDLPRADPEPLPPRPSDIDTNEESKKAWKKEAHEIHSSNAQLKSLRAEFVQRINLAKRLEDEPRLFFPHNFDFRGRAYPIPPLLNHHGPGSSRCLLLSARRRPLDERGRRWLKVHASNMYGYDKADYDSRAAFIDDKIGEIEAIANAPENHMELWEEADEPLQYVAACMALTFDEIGERLLVQADGSCNGLQHYTAAGRDEHAAASVNLIPSPTPGDAYTDVLGFVLPRLEEAASKAHPTALKLLPYVLKSGRAILKQPVMTKNYNVTLVGARSQVRSSLKKHGYPTQELYEGAAFLSKIVMKSVGEAFPAAQAIMAWIETCARKCVNSRQAQPLSWIGPTGFPVVQPYRSSKLFRINTLLQSISIAANDVKAPLSKKKQTQAASPNVIHSWDGAHEHLTAISCHEEDIDFAAVHDSYWTHAATMDDLHTILREQFIEMHAFDLVGDLYEQWSAAFPRVELPPPPPKGNLDLNLIRESPYFFH